MGILAFIHLLKNSDVSGKVWHVELDFRVSQLVAHTSYLHIDLSLLIERLFSFIMEPFACKTLLSLNFIGLFLILKLLSYECSSLVGSVIVRNAFVFVRMNGKSHI